MESGDASLADQLVIDYRQAPLSPARRALCDYAAKLTVAPGQVGAADLDRLRRHGWTDVQLLVAVQVISYFNYINRVADALGVEPETWMQPPQQEWLQRKGRDYHTVHHVTCRNGRVERRGG